MSERKYPKGFTDKKGAIASIDEFRKMIKNVKGDDAIRIIFKVSFRQWNEKKGKYV